MIVLLVLSGRTAYSQIVQGAGTVNVCAPGSVTYTAPAGASGISWTFGSFAPSSLATGGFNVGTPQTFTAVFSGVVGGSPVSFSVVVVAHAKPVVAFSIAQPPNTCAVRTVTFTDQSSSASSIASWQWVFGDGGTSSGGGTQTYGYTLPGTYSVTLKVTDIYGCDDQLTQGSILVTAAPGASISSNPPVLSSCNQALSAVFSASNSSGPNLTYQWDFGNGSTSSAQTSGNITYTAQSMPYVVTLTVGSAGCSSTASTQVIVSPPSLSISINPTICLNAPFDASVTSSEPVVTWSLSNGYTFTHATIPYLMWDTVRQIPGFSSVGTKTISASIGIGPCAIVKTTTVYVEQVIANMSVTAVTSCSSPVTASYTNLSSTNAVSFYWSYYDWQNILHVSNLANPTFTFSEYSTNPYTVYENYFPTPVLIVTSAAGCVATATVQPLVNLQVPTARFKRDKRQGCVPLTVTFTNTSYPMPLYPISNYTWCNGAVPPVFVTGVGSPSIQVFTYTAAGSYTPYLQIQTVGGCTAVSFMEPIFAVNTPSISFVLSSSLVCPGQPVQVINTTPNTGDFQHWHVESDDGTFWGCITDPSPAWSFSTVGTHTLNLQGTTFGCSATAVPATVTVEGPIVNNRYETNCTNRKVVNFYPLLQSTSSAVLNFGDGNQVGITGNPTGTMSPVLTHTYLNTGDYTVTLTGSSTGSCPANTFTMLVKVRDVQANIVMPTAVCVNADTIFQANGSVDVFTVGCSGRDKNYVWYFDALPPSDSLQTYEFHTFTSIGIHSVSLLVKDENDCTSLLTKTISVSGPTPTFTFNQNPACYSDGTVQLINTTSQLPDPIVLYDWYFGDGATYSTTSAAPISHAYSSAQPPASLFLVMLTATNAIGCVNTGVDSLWVVRPSASFSVPNNYPCLPGGAPINIPFTALNSYPSYTFNFGSPTQTLATASSTASHWFAPGLYTVALTVREPLRGCENTQTLLISAVQTPTASFQFESPGAVSSNAICYPSTVKFFNLSQPLPNTPQWNLGTGSPVLPLDTVYASYPASAGIVTVSLFVSTGAPNYCSSGVAKTFTLYEASANIVLSSTTVCLGKDLAFSIDTTNGGFVRSWVWDFGDATTSNIIYASPGTPPATTHNYSIYPAASAGSATASLIYFSADNACRYFSSREIEVVKVDASIHRNAEIARIDSIHCFRIEDRFHATGGATAPYLAYAWHFSGGGSSNDTAASYTFPAPGVQQVSLEVSDTRYGCIADAVKNMTILPLPTATMDPGEFCPAVPFPITGTLGANVVTGTLLPAESMVSASQFTASGGLLQATGMAQVSTTYSLLVTDVNGCVSDPVTDTVRIVQPAPAVKWDTSVVVGQPIPINGYAGNFTYTWSPVSTALSCTLCPSPVSTSTNNITYFLQAEDLLHCSVTTSTFHVVIEDKASVDVPTAFTPNGDGVNDVIYVAGWGIRKLNYFRIYNRWGQLLFESNDITKGWDGTFAGVPQNMETYVYQVSVDTYRENDLFKTSTFKLIR